MNYKFINKKSIGGGNRKRGIPPTTNLWGVFLNNRHLRAKARMIITKNEKLQIIKLQKLNSVRIMKIKLKIR